MINRGKNAHPVYLILLAVLLWVMSAVFAFLLIVPILDSVIMIFAAFWADPQPFGESYFVGTTIRQMGVFVLATAYVIGIIGSAEHLAKNFNTPASWHFILMIYTVLLTLFLFTLFF